MRIRHAAWERKLRRQLRSKQPPRGKKDNPLLEVLALGAMGGFVTAVLSLGAGNDQGRGAAITLVSGFFGAMLGACLRARWLDGSLLLTFAPISPSGMRRFESRAALPTLLHFGIGGLIAAVLGAIPGGPIFMLKAVPIALSAMAVGMALSSGKRGKIIIWASLIAAFGWSFLAAKQMTFVDGALRQGFVLAWLPALPWSLWGTDASFVAARLGVFSACLGFTLAEWRHAWGRWGVREAVALEEQELSKPPETAERQPTLGGLPEPEVEEEEDPRPELRSGLRQTVSHGWVGMAAFVNPGWLSKLDWLQWRSMAPRQRLLWCLGTYGARGWFRRSAIGAGLLGVAVALVLTMRLSSLGKLGPAMQSHGYLMIFPTLIFIVVAAKKCWPGDASGFSPWLELFRPGMRALPMISIFPVSPREWVACAVREWLVRATWIALLWSLASLAVGIIWAEGPLGFRYLFGWFMMPWLWMGSILPFSVGGRLLRSCSGPLRGSHASSLVFVAILLNTIAPAAVIATIASYWARFLPGFAGGLALAAVAGWAGLRLSIAIASNMRLDATPAHDPIAGR